MQAVLMAGGKGTRLRPFTAILPKPLVPIGEISILELVLLQLKHFGFRRIIISVGHKAELIMAVIGDGGQFGLNISYHREEHPLGTVGALAEMEQLEENFLVINGDICTNLNFQTIYQDHVSNSATATIGVFSRKEKIQLGIVTTNHDRDRIVGFQEKPCYDYLVSMGVYAIKRSVVELIPKNKFFGFDQLMLKMIDKGEHIRPYLFKGLWRDIGMPADYDLMIQEFQADPAIYLPEGA